MTQKGLICHKTKQPTNQLMSLYFQLTKVTNFEPTDKQKGLLINK